VETERILHRSRTPYGTYGFTFLILACVAATALPRKLIADDDRAAGTHVSVIYPTADVVPENLLKFYICFSAPMSRGDAYRHVRLMRDDDVEIEFPFLELPEELWDPQQTRFTLFFDPGRIKRGLKPREEFGPALEEGRSYTLIVESSWLDAQGRPIREQARKSFRVVAPDDMQPDPTAWKIDSPDAESRAPLIVRFGEPLDFGLATRVIHVENEAGEIVPGEMRLENRDRAGRFVPQRPWVSGNYNLVVDTRLEDLAGNSPARPFEVDLFDRVEASVPVESVRLPWTIR
jgi:hypothetical protein